MIGLTKQMKLVAGVLVVGLFGTVCFGAGDSASIRTPVADDARSAAAKKTLEQGGYTNVINGGSFRAMKKHLKRRVATELH